MSQYPPNDSAREPNGFPAARIASVVPDSPAYDAGFEPGCFVTSVDGSPVRDVIDWRWLSADESMTVGYVDLDGDVTPADARLVLRRSVGLEKLFVRGG